LRKKKVRSIFEFDKKNQKLFVKVSFCFSFHAFVSTTSTTFFSAKVDFTRIKIQTQASAAFDRSGAGNRTSIAMTVLQILEEPFDRQGSGL
jgi:hypothetical protein